MTVNGDQVSRVANGSAGAWGGLAKSVIHDPVVWNNGARYAIPPYALQQRRDRQQGRHAASLSVHAFVSRTQRSAQRCVAEPGPVTMLIAMECGHRSDWTADQQRFVSCCAASRARG